MTDIRCQLGRSLVILACVSNGVLLASLSGLLVFFASVPLFAQTPPVAEERDVRIEEADVGAMAQLARAEQAARESQWNEAIDALLAASDTESERLVLASVEREIPGGEAFRRYLPMRVFVQRQIESLGRASPPLVEHYRRRVDATAKKQLDIERPQADHVPLERLVRDMEQSSVGPAALWELGERLLDAGDFHRARAAWERIDPAARTTPADAARDAVRDTSKTPRVPFERSIYWTFAAAGRLNDIETLDPWRALRPIKLDDQERPPVDLVARLTLVSILSGDERRAAWELARLGRLYPQATGEMGGKRGLWTQLLGDLLASSREWPHDLDSGWQQFAHDSRRTSAASQSLDPAGRPRWQVALKPLTTRLPPLGNSRNNRADDSSEAARKEPSPIAERLPRGDLLPFHPVAVGDWIAIQDTSGLRVWHAETGRPLTAGDERALVHASPVSPLWLESPNVRVLGIPQFPLASSRSSVWARCGAPWVSADRPLATDQHPARLVAVDLNAEGRTTVSWTLDEPQFGVEWTWEGPPVVRDGRAYVGLRRSDAVQTQAHVACWDVTTGQLVWRRMIAAASTPRARRSLEWTQCLLTWHEGRLFYHAKVGAVACLNPTDGTFDWLVQYPRSTDEATLENADAAFRRRELSPCVAHHDLIVVTPADDGQVFALEASTGRLVWTCGLPTVAESTQTLGISDGHVVLGGESLTWLDLATGQVRAQFPPPGSLARGMARPGPRGFGRGLVVGDEVWWPTYDQILVFRTRPATNVPGGAPVAVRQIDLQSRQARGGNLILHRGMLYIASVDTLYAFGE